MVLYKIRVEQVVDDLSDPDDRDCSPEGQYFFEADNREEALDLFHATIPIGCLEDFDIQAFKQ